MIKTDTNYIDNPVQTKLQEILFALYDLNKIGDNWWGKEHLHQEICKLELLEQELFPINVKKKKEPTLNCGCCGKTLHIGNSIQYDNNYNPYCDNTECTEGIATYGTCLEDCWWDDEFWEEFNRVGGCEEKMWNKIKKENKK